jgi:glucose/arabinose dehydrogenase
MRPRRRSRAIGILIAPTDVMNLGLSSAGIHSSFAPGRAVVVGAALALGVIAMTGCGGKARLPFDAGVGPRPAIPPPEKSLLPTLNVAPAKGWPAGGMPIPASGLAVNAFATGLEHPRWLYVLPNGDVLVAETNAPPKPEDAKGIRGWVQKRIMKRAGSITPSANRITLLRDSRGTGVADQRYVFADKLNSPFGMVLAGNEFYVADSDAVLSFRYVEGATRVEGPGSKVIDLPAGPINHHWTKNLIASEDGSRLYATVGSNSNVGENGLAAEEGRAAVWEIDPASGQHRIYAYGLRNPNGLAWVPQTGKLWAVVNERDELGSDLVPDYMTALVEGGFYGFPYSYYGAHVDDRVKEQRPDLVAKALVPDYALGAHTASLGLVYEAGRPGRASGPFSEGMFVGQHGSWNRKPLSGYRVIFVPFKDGSPSGMPVDVLTGFLDEHGDAYGRPVGVVLDKRGALLVADDVGNTVWRVSPAADNGRVAPAD